MGGHFRFRPNRPVYTALFLLLVGAFSRDGDSSCFSKHQSCTDIGSVIVDNTYVDLPFAVVHDVGDTMYEDTLDHGLIWFARHCLCLPGAHGFYVPRRRRSSCAGLLHCFSSLVEFNQIQNQQPTATTTDQSTWDVLTCVLRSTNPRKFI